MAAKSGDGGKSWRQRALTWLYGIASTPGWRRRLTLAAAAILFVVALLALRGGVDFRVDPSALIPRSVSTYMETRDLGKTLETIGSWRVWTPERQESPSQLKVDLAGILGNLAPGLGTRQPLSWLSGADRAAFAFTEGEGGGGRSWAVYLNIPEPEKALKEFSVEPDLTLARLDGAEVFSLSGKGGGRLFFSVVSPWLVVSSDALLPTFALNSVRQPAFSLSGSGILPDWRRGVTVRGMCTPGMNAGALFTFPFAFPADWVNPEARMTFTGRLSADGGADAVFLAKVLSEDVNRGGARAVFMLLFAFLGLLGLVIVAVILLTIIGWGGWIKAAALRAGAVPADAPAEVEPSAAFAADSGAQAEAEIVSVEPSGEIPPETNDPN